jgi:hypothetical protein
MRPTCPWSCATALFGALLGNCGGDGTPSGATAGDGGSASASESGVAIDAAVPDTTSCVGDLGACLFGTVQIDQFALAPSGFKASLYRVFPSGTALPMNSQPVAKDRTWAFVGLATWAHYYVVIEPGFPSRAAPSRTVATRIGPLAVPNASSAPVEVHVKPVQLDVLEDSIMGGPAQVQAASARLFDGTTGGEIGSGATVSITIGTTSTPMPWTQSASAYEATFMPPPSAQSAYQILVSLKSGAPQTTWNLVADPPQLAGTISSPPSGATISVNGLSGALDGGSNDLIVKWPVPAPADYEIVDLYWMTNGSWSRVYTSPQPVAPDKDSETIPAGSVAQPGSYLLNVAFTKANCPPTADGCVEASTIANELLTAQ